MLTYFQARWCLMRLDWPVHVLAGKSAFLFQQHHLVVNGRNNSLLSNSFFHLLQRLCSHKLFLLDFFNAFSKNTLILPLYILPFKHHLLQEHRFLSHHPLLCFLSLTPAVFGKIRSPGQSDRLSLEIWHPLNCESL